MRYLVLMGAALLGCGGSDGDEDETAFMCEQSDRSGTYLMSHDERPGGTCGPIPDQLGRLDGTGDVPAGCILDAPDEWSADGCRLDRSLTCCDGTFCSSAVATTVQRDADGAVLSGIISMRIEEIGASGLVLSACASTYDLSAVRQ